MLGHPGRLTYTGKDKADAAGSANRICVRRLKPRKQPAREVAGDVQDILKAKPTKEPR